MVIAMVIAIMIIYRIAHHKYEPFATRFADGLYYLLQTHRLASHTHTSYASRQPPAGQFNRWAISSVLGRVLVLTLSLHAIIVVGIW